MKKNTCAIFEISLSNKFCNEYGGGLHLKCQPVVDFLIITKQYLTTETLGLIIKNGNFAQLKLKYGKKPEIIPDIIKWIDPMANCRKILVKEAEITVITKVKLIHQPYKHDLRIY